MHAHLAHQIGAVNFDRTGRNVQFMRDLLAGETGDKKIENLPFASGKGLVRGLSARCGKALRAIVVSLLQARGADGQKFLDLRAER